MPAVARRADRHTPESLLAVAVVNEQAIDESLVADKGFAHYLRHHGLGGTKDMIAAGILRGTPGERRRMRACWRLGARRW